MYYDRTGFLLYPAQHVTLKRQRKQLKINNLHDKESLSIEKALGETKQKATRK